jgi:asparagine synthetase B (glutamine-hydrolysing)
MDVGWKWTVNFAGSVLWMQGLEPTTQPVKDDECNCLLWNGDVFNGLIVREQKYCDRLYYHVTHTPDSSVLHPGSHRSENLNVRNEPQFS